MKEKGTVTEVGKESVTVEVTPHGECHKCGLCQGTRSDMVNISGENSKGLYVGDVVEIEVSSSSMMRMYSFLYGLPLVVFVGVMLVIYVVLRSPILSFAGGLLGTAIVYLIIGSFMRSGRVFSPDITVTKVPRELT